MVLLTTGVGPVVNLKVCISVCVLRELKNGEGVSWFVTLDLQESQMKKRPTKKRMQTPYDSHINHLIGSINHIDRPELGAQSQIILQSHF